jgi:hypothetical protein
MRSAIIDQTTIAEPAHDRATSGGTRLPRFKDSSSKTGDDLTVSLSGSSAPSFKSATSPVSIAGPGGAGAITGKFITLDVTVTVTAAEAVRVSHGSDVVAGTSGQTDLALAAVPHINQSGRSNTLRMTAIGLNATPVIIAAAGADALMRSDGPDNGAFGTKTKSFAEATLTHPPSETTLDFLASLRISTSPD